MFSAADPIALLSQEKEGQLDKLSKNLQEMQTLIEKRQNRQQTKAVIRMKMQKKLKDQEIMYKTIKKKKSVSGQRYPKANGGKKVNH